MAFSSYWDLLIKVPTAMDCNIAQDVQNASVELPESSTAVPTKSQMRKALEKVTVSANPRKSSGARNYAKADYCLFCKGKYTSKIYNHFTSVHQTEEQVKKLMDLPSGSRERRRLLKLLRNEGNHVHNLMVIQNGQGELTISRRPSTQDAAKAECYLPCTECLSWIYDKSLSLHARTCPATRLFNNNFLRNSKMLLLPFLTLHTDEHDLQNIFLHMKETTKHPGLRKIAENDLLVKEFCRGLRHKLGTEEEQRRNDKDNIRTKVRTITRLIVALNDKCKYQKQLDDYIRPSCFNLLTQTVKEMALEANSPNLALTLGHYLKQICQLKKSLALQAEDHARLKEAKSFDLLYNAHWNSYVSAVALRRLKLRTLNKQIELPKTNDLVLLKDYLDEEINTILSQKVFTLEQWTAAAQILMVRIILFNKRRVSEVEELKLSDFRQRLEKVDNQDILTHLDVTEKMLANRMSLVEVRGKSTRGIRKVFILLSENMVKVCNHLIAFRLQVGIQADNAYMFARINGGPLDGCKAMRDVPEKCPFLESPHLIRTRLLRKYLVTTVQILDMTGDELKMIADHMGHSIDVHTNVYRLQSSLLETTKVARALISLENGQMQRFSGRNLSTCSLDKLPPIFADAEEDLLEDVQLEDNDTRNTIDDDETTVDSTVPGSSLTSKSRIGLKRKRWEKDEENALFKAFGSCIHSKKNATADQIRNSQNEYPCLKRRSVAMIKTKINNIILGKCKLSNTSHSM